MLETCRRFNITDSTILDCANRGLLLKDVSDSRVSDCLIRDNRPEASSVPLDHTGFCDQSVPWGRVRKAAGHLEAEDHGSAPLQVPHPDGLPLVLWERHHDISQPQRHFTFDQSLARSGLVGCRLKPTQHRRVNTAAHRRMFAGPFLLVANGVLSVQVDHVATMNLQQPNCVPQSMRQYRRSP